jgi:hypothetical protein
MLLEQQPQHLQHVACALGPLVEKQGAVLRQRHPSRHRDLAAGDQVVLGDGVGRGAKGLGGDEGRMAASQPVDIIERACRRPVVHTTELGRTARRLDKQRAP